MRIVLYCFFKFSCCSELQIFQSCKHLPFCLLSCLNFVEDDPIKKPRSIVVVGCGIRGLVVSSFHDTSIKSCSLRQLKTDIDF
ncbi:hypothetical protein QVD17_31850 [Tagetes erecta]|uniref:Uncharacterized protein n=1 Tax=Tagetes erecta TaxID=13708 RepID=A0AAD8K4J9_TARER|nr:hypothetical protein QVD17_37821 [Tagetes erecta]KAK1416062.1 hypothetical protein QVD17_31850 [Tagetes erecta]